jgi:hypothetical protein
VLLLGLGVGVAVAKFASPFPFAASPTPTASAAPSRSATPSPASDDVSAWTPYVDAADKFSLRYPPAWQQRTCKVGAHTTLYLAPTAAGLGVCNSDASGMMSIGAQDGDQRAALKWTATTYPDVTTANVSTASLTAIRQTATVSSSAALGPEPGSKLVQYLFYSSGRTYLASYTQKPADTSALADFDRLVTTTFTITP